MKLLHDDATAQSLSFLRFYVFGLWLFAVLLEPMHLVSYMPERIFRPIGILQLVPRSAFSILLQPVFLHGLKIAMLLSLLFAMGGRLRRPAAVLACALLTLHATIIRSCTTISHAELALLYGAFVLTLFDLADAFNNRHGRQTDLSVNPHAVPIQAIAMLILLTYSFVGVRRMLYGGLDIFTRGGMDYYIIRNSFVPMDYNFKFGRLGVDYPVLRDLLNTGAGCATALEILAPLCLVFTRFRRIWLLIMFSFHIGVMLMMNYLFWENCAMFLVLINYHRWISASGFPAWPQEANPGASDP